MEVKIKDLEYYMQLPYRILLYPPRKTGEDWGAEIPDLPGCTTQAVKRKDVLDMIDEAKEIWIEMMLNADQVIPEPEAI
jgi:antitoxin HicB